MTTTEHDWRRESVLKLIRSKAGKPRHGYTPITWFGLDESPTIHAMVKDGVIRLLDITTPQGDTRTVVIEV